jgi:hypothetical protein
VRTLPHARAVTHRTMRPFIQAKQLKLIPFPNMDLDTDVPMSDAEPLLSDVVHSRLSSNASSLAYYDSDSPLSDSPTCNIFPLRQRLFVFTSSLCQPHIPILAPALRLTSPPHLMLILPTTHQSTTRSASFSQRALLYTMGMTYIYLLPGSRSSFLYGRPSVPTVHRFQNSAWPVPRASTVSDQCGLTANNAALSLSWKVTETFF